MTTDALEPNRRDFIVVAGNAFAAVGAASLLWPFIQQMNPDASTKALSSVDVDLSPVKEGQAITAMWRGKPIFIRNRTKAEIESAVNVDVKNLPDGLARNDDLPTDDPATDANRTKEGHENWIIHRRHLHAFGLHPEGPGAWAMNAANTAAGSARATARSTIRPAAFAKDRRRAIWKCHPTRSRQTPRLRSAREFALR